MLEASNIPVEPTPSATSQLVRELTKACESQGWTVNEIADVVGVIPSMLTGDNVALFAPHKLATLASMAGYRIILERK